MEALFLHENNEATEATHLRYYTMVGPLKCYHLHTLLSSAVLWVMQEMPIKRYGICEFSL